MAIVDFDWESVKRQGKNRGGKMKAGITGWAQVCGWCGDTSLEKRIEFDLYYIEHWSIWLDLKIMWLTIWQGFVHKHAY